MKSNNSTQIEPVHVERTFATLQHTDRKMGPALADWRARKVARHIDSNIEHPLRVRDLADLVGLSAGWFSRSFHSRFGVTARNYVALRRIEFAKSQMLATDRPLVEIALLCGMSDQAHFAKTFRRVVGTTPRQWRNAHCG